MSEGPYRHSLASDSSNSNAVSFSPGKPDAALNRSSLEPSSCSPVTLTAPSYFGEIAHKKWALTIQGTRLIAEVPRIEKFCWRVIAVDDDPQKPLLRSLQVGPESATFDVEWGKATSASVTLVTESGGQRWDFGRFTRPLSVQTFEDWSFEIEPIEVTVVLQRGRKLLAAERTWHLADP